MRGDILLSPALTPSLPPSPTPSPTHSITHLHFHCHSHSHPFPIPLNPSTTQQLNPVHKIEVHNDRTVPTRRAKLMNSAVTSLVGVSELTRYAATTNSTAEVLPARFCLEAATPVSYHNYHTYLPYGISLDSRLLRFSEYLFPFYIIFIFT